MNKKKKLLIYSDCYIYGGSERLMSFLVRNQMILKDYHITFAYRKHKIYQNGIDLEFNDREKKKFLFPVSVISNATIIYKISLKNYPVLLKKILKFPLIVIDKIGIYFIYNIISQIVTLKMVSPDIIHINNGGYPGAKSCNTMVIAAKLMRFKYIIYQVNNIAQKRTGIFDQLYDKFINKSVNYFITASKQACEKLAKERNFQPYKIIQVPNTVIDELTTLSRKEVLTGLSINLTDFVLCTVGFLSKRKGQHFLLEALYKISQNQPDIFKKIKLILVGDGEEMQFLKNYANEYKISSHVFFIGYQNRSIDYINACDLFILPSIANEDMPLVVLSAMSKGKVIVSTDFAGIREEIENGVSGILIPPNINTIVINLAKIVVKLYNNRNHQYGEEAKKRFNSLFSSRKYGQSIVNIYTTTINQTK